jgi:hypothetical protein
LIGVDLYEDLYGLVIQFLRTLSVNMDLDESRTIALFDDWLFAAGPDVPFLQNPDGSDEPN